jgi:hypothetical protein
VITRVITPRGSWPEVFALRAGAAQPDRPAKDEGSLMRDERDAQRRAARPVTDPPSVRPSA